MKMKVILLSIALVGIILVGCDADEEPTTSPTPIVETTGEETDAVTSASIVNNEIDFEKAMAKDGTWIIATLNDLTFNKDIVLEGDFQNSKGETQRKIALYAQDENRTVTSRYTLSAPKLTIKSPKASIQHGTFKGDLYVETTDFELVDNKVDGNIYFVSEEAKTGFKMDAESSVSGTQEVQK